MGDISRKEVLENFAGYMAERYGHVDYLINNAAAGRESGKAAGYCQYSAVSLL